MKYGLPSPLTPDEEKNRPEFGAKVMNSILESTKEYRDRRNKLFDRCRKYAEGKQDITPLLDMMSIDGNQPILNLHLKALPIASKFENIVVEGYSMRRERPKVISMSKDVQNRKDMRRKEALFRMNYRDQISQLAESTGLPLEDPDAYTPEDMDDAEIHFYLEDREIEEMLMQKAISFCLQDNDVDELKKQLLSDLFRYNLLGLYEYMDENSRPRIKRINPFRAIYDVSERPDFEDKRFAGHIETMSIGEIRSYWNVPPEKERYLYKAAILSGYSGPWDDAYRINASSRPYDNYTCEVVFFWWKCNKGINFVEGTNRYGREIFDISQYEVKESTRKRSGKIYPQTSYKGVGILGTNHILEWGEEKNIVREGEDKEKVICPYSYYMPGNSGSMLVPSSVDKMIPHIIDMEIAIAKLRLITSTITPDAPIVDIAGMDFMETGGGEDGGGTVPPYLEMLKIYFQTGATIWSSVDSEGNPKSASPPILPSTSPVVHKAQTLMNSYNFHLSMIRDMIGVNEFRDGSAIPSRTGFRVMQSALDSSNTATYPIYSAYVYSMNKTQKRIGIRIWDSLFFSSNPNKGIVGILGKNNIDLLQYRKDITASQYDFSYELEMDGAQKEDLETRINTALAAGTLDLADAELIRETYDFRIATKQLRIAMEKKRKRDLEYQKEMQMLNSEAQAMAGERIEAAKQQTIQLQGQIDMQLENMTREAQRDSSFEKLISDVIVNSMDPTKVLPEYLAAPLQEVILNRLTSIQQQLNQKTMAIQEQQMAERQAYLNSGA